MRLRSPVSLLMITLAGVPVIPKLCPSCICVFTRSLKVPMFTQFLISSASPHRDSAILKRLLRLVSCSPYVASTKA